MVLAINQAPKYEYSSVHELLYLPEACMIFSIYNTIKKGGGSYTKRT